MEPLANDVFRQVEFGVERCYDVRTVTTQGTVSVESADAGLLKRVSDDFPAFEATLKGDPRLTVQALREPAYYAKQSEMVTTLITVLGTLVAVVMGLGAVFGALNTMYSAVAERAREIAAAAPAHSSRLVFQYYPIETTSIAYVLAKGCQVAGNSRAPMSSWRQV